MYNALKRHDAAVTVWIDGIAASIASMIAMAGDEVVMPENAMLMLHDPSGLVIGTASDKQSVDQQFARWVMLHVQSNPLPISRGRGC